VAENLLKVEVRESVGKGVARKLRAAGRIPGVIYGRAVGPQPITLDPLALRRTLAKSEAGLNTLFSLEVAGGGALHGKPVLIRDLQRDPVRGAYLHADLLAVDLLQKLEVRVPIHITGKAKGVEFGGILDHSLREIELECLPTAIPREIQVDVSGLDVGDSLHVRDLLLPEGVELRSDPDLSVVSVVLPQAEAAPAAAAPAEGEAAAAAPAEGEAAAAAAPAEKKEKESKE
jgi:large subunit ribosomal protein L25